MDKKEIDHSNFISCLGLTGLVLVRDRVYSAPVIYNVIQGSSTKPSPF